MSEETRTRRSFSQEFKREAIRLVTEEGYRATEAARNLGIHVNLIYRWKSQLMSKDKQAETVTEDEKSELKRLRKENQRLRMERDILKKATAFFAKENQ